MNCTVQTDASYSKLYQIGAYAYVIISDLGRYKTGGILKESSASASQAEMKCICNALHYITTNPELMAKVTRIHINTDSVNAIHLFTNDKKAIQRWGLSKKSYKNILKKYHEIRHILTGKAVIFDHVKAHTDKNDKRSYQNKWCDEEAKRHMSIALAKYNNKVTAIKT